MTNFRAVPHIPGIPAISAAIPLAVAAAFPLASFAQPVFELAPTVVTATRFAEPLQTLPLGVSVITADEIRRSGATTVNDALMRILGLPGRQDFYGGGEYSIDLRGFGSTSDVNQVVIVDGQRVSEADLGGTRLAGIPIESVERIEVLRGSGAVLYGEGATGGVIVITTKAGAGKDRPNGASVYAGAGSYGLRDYRANANVGAGGFSIDASAQKRDSDNSFRDNFRSRADAQSVTGQWANDTVRIGARYARDALDTGLPGALSAAQYAANPRQTTTPDDQASIRNERGSVFARAQLGNWDLAADAGTRTKRLRSVNGGFPFDYNISANDGSLRARNQSAFGSVKNILIAGWDRDSWSRDVLGDFGSTASQSSNAFYVKDDVLLARGTRLTAGWRTERIEKNSSSADSGVDAHPNAWEFGASQQLAQGLEGWARYGHSFRVANVDEFSFTSPGVILAPQTSHDLEAGLRWTHAQGSVEARIYRSDLENEIGFDPAAVGPFGTFGANVNFDPTRRQGIELDARQALTRTVGLRVNLTTRDAKFRSGPYAGNELPLVPKQTAAVRADWAFAANQVLSGGIVWVASSHPDFQNACTIPSYTTADARYAYTWRNAEFSLGVTNLFDTKYYTQAFGCAGGVTTSIYPEAGRAFTGAVRLTF